MTVLVADNAGHLELLYGFLYGCTRRYLSRCLLVYVKSGCLLRMRRMKRPAAAPTGRMMKRPACASASSAPSAVFGASSAVQKIEGICCRRLSGERYRREVTDLGRGFSVYDMKSKLQIWGYDASREACEQLLKRYRLGYGSMDGGVGEYDVYRDDLLRWYHAECLGLMALQYRFLAEHLLGIGRSYRIQVLRRAELP